MLVSGIRCCRRHVCTDFLLYGAAESTYLLACDWISICDAPTGGVPTVVELAAQFDDIMVDIRKAEYLPSNGKASMLDSALATLADKAKIKPTGTAVGDTPLALLARAQYHVHRGELAIAVAELEQLSGYQVRN